MGSKNGQPCDFFEFAKAEGGNNMKPDQPVKHVPACLAKPALPTFGYSAEFFNSTWHTW
jgi:hypothetical protein